MGELFFFMHFRLPALGGQPPQAGRVPMFTAAVNGEAPFTEHVHSRSAGDPFRAADPCGKAGRKGAPGGSGRGQGEA